MSCARTIMMVASLRSLMENAKIPFAENPRISKRNAEADFKVRGLIAAPHVDSHFTAKCKTQVLASEPPSTRFRDAMETLS